MDDGIAKINHNPGTTFDWVQSLMSDVFINKPAVEDTISCISGRAGKDKPAEIASLLKAVTCMDLTTLCSDDTECSVQRLCHKAEYPIDKNLLDYFGIDSKEFHVAAVCVYPARVKDCVKALKDIKSNVPVAAVAAGFPSAQYHLDSKLEEVKCCVNDGAKEIDIVISRELVLKGEWKELYEEVKAMKEACGSKALLKTIIAAGELGSLDNVYKTSIVCMAAGSDFIKTSTGKESVNATLPIGMVMARAIRAYNDSFGYEVGFKPAGGIRTAKDVILWQHLMKKELGHKWLHPSLFRFGASGLLNDIEKNIFLYIMGCNPSKHVFTYQ